jgi:hypothetical protein
MVYAPGDPGVERVVLCDIEVAHRIDTPHVWTQDGATGAWWILHKHTDKFGEHEGKPSQVKVNGAIFTEATLANCRTTASTWHWEPAPDNYLYIHVAGGVNPGNGNFIIAAYLWRRFATEFYEFGGRPYLPLVAKESIPPVSYVTGGYHEGGTKQTFGTIRLLNGEGYFDTDLSDYIYEGKRLIARIGERGAVDADFAVFWDGWTGDIRWTENEVEIMVEDLMTGVI